MSGDQLRLASAHVRELAAPQRRAEAEVLPSTEVVDGVDSSHRITHGPIARGTAAAVEAAQHARRAAGLGMKAVSEYLGHKLDTAAARYDETDSATSGRLDEQMRPSSP